MNVSSRLHAIDIFRAFTMWMMIFVNDLWTLEGIPKWLEHTAASEDGMGLADTVFPAFLVLVGLSIPFAIQKRMDQGQNKLTILKHISVRSFALVAMGVFHVNLENYNKAMALLPKPIFQILLTLAFFLIWLDYKKENQKVENIFKILGVGLLVFLASIYTGGDAQHPVWLKPYWWGILGLIGWAYFTSSLVFLVAGGRLFIQVLALVIFYGLSALVKTGVLSGKDVWLVGSGAMAAFTTGGVVLSLILQRFQEKRTALVGMMFLLAFLFLGFGFLTRPLWGISKIGATPSWVGICTGISILVWLGIMALADWKGKAHWFSFLKPAGTSTLTCYLLPYIHYALFSLIGWSLPLVLRTGPVGILKSLIYGLVIIGVTGFLEKKRLRLTL